MVQVYHIGEKKSIAKGVHQGSPPPIRPVLARVTPERSSANTHEALLALVDAAILSVNRLRKNHWPSSLAYSIFEQGGNCWELIIPRKRVSK